MASLDQFWRHNISRCALDVLKAKLFFGALDKVKFPRKVVVHNYSGLQQKLFPGQVEFSS